MVCFFTLAALLGGGLWAHPGIDKQIRDVTAQIDAAPSDATLYLRRGELHRLHQDWPKAEADYRKALALDSQLVVASYCLGRLKLDSGDAAAAKRILDDYLAERPEDPDALATRARARVELGDPVGAAEDFSRAIDHMRDTPSHPEYYLERARALASAGPTHIPDAINGLDAGLERIGAAVTLQLYAIDLELDRRNYDGALRRLDQLSSQSVRQEPWLVRKASILEAAGRKDDARDAYRETLSSIEALPASRRNNKAVERLENEAREALKRLGATNTHSNN